MRFKIITTVITLTILSGLFFSCKKVLDLEPTDVIDEDKAFLTVQNLEQGLNGVYSQIGTGLVNGFYLGSLLSDEVKLSTENLGTGTFSFKWQYTSAPVGNDASGDWLTFYRAIDRAHRILNAIPNVPAANDSEEAQKRRIQAELIGFRAIAHFELLRRYMPSGYDPNALGVPIVLESRLLQQPPRSTVGEVIAQVLSDLATARASDALPNTVADGLRLSKAALAGYQARVALLSRDWNSAITFATDAITLSGKVLATRTQYSSIWADSANHEVILKFNNNYGISTLWRSAQGTVDYEPSIKLKRQYNRTTDIRFPTFFGSAGTVGNANYDSSIVRKYPGNTVGPTINHLKAMRTSEMYLIRAEAYAETNQLDKAASEINAIRSNRITGYTNVTYSSKEEAITDILTERFKELAFEGFRFFDLKRRGLPVERINEDVSSSLTWFRLEANDYRFALPIPSEEIFANPNIIQNPDY